jgi:hypothetical protein
MNVAPVKKGKRQTPFNLGKFVRVHGKKLHERRRGIDPLILDLAITVSLYTLENVLFYVYTCK